MAWIHSLDLCLSKALITELIPLRHVLINQMPWVNSIWSDTVFEPPTLHFQQKAQSLKKNDISRTKACLEEKQRAERDIRVLPHQYPAYVTLARLPWRQCRGKKIKLFYMIWKHLSNIKFSKSKFISQFQLLIT